MVTLAKSTPGTEIRDGVRVDIGTPKSLDEVFASDPLGLLDEKPRPIAQFETVGFVELGGDGRLRFTDVNGTPLD